ncbi:hypothetical protein OG604_47710 [Streptomyces sp. NBC_01231]|nr:hypothetical protein OG604_47710 [Streptomyces sp. NBC_01231]
MSPSTCSPSTKERPPSRPDSRDGRLRPPHRSNSVAYTHVLADAITGYPRRFTTMDMVEELWGTVGPVLDLPDTPYRYDVGSWGPEGADHLATDSRWLPLEQA